MSSTAAMKLPPRSPSPQVPIIAPCEEQIRSCILTAEVKTLNAVPTHNGHGSIGDGREPAWFAHRYKIVRGFMKWPPMPPIEVLGENFRQRSEKGSWAGVVFKLKGAMEPGIPYCSNMGRLAKEAMESPLEPVAPSLSRADQLTPSTDQYVRIYLRWPGYGFAMLRTVQIYCAKDGVSITRLGLLNQIVVCLETLCRQAIYLDRRGGKAAQCCYDQRRTCDQRCWQLAPLGPTAQREGRISLDCLWVVGLHHCWDDIFMVDVLFAEEDAPPRFGRPYYSQHYEEPDGAAAPTLY